MAGSLSNFAEKLVLDFLLTTGAVTRPTTWYLALYTSATDESTGGTEVSTSGTGYTRQAVTFGPATTPGGVAANSNTPTFTAAGSNWGTITDVRVFDAVSGGNPILYSTVTIQRVINDGDTISFPAGQITLTLD